MTEVKTEDWWLPWSLHSAAGVRAARTEEKTGLSGRDDDSRKSEEKRGQFVALDRKSPPFAKNAKDGAPSSSVVAWRNGRNPRGRSELRPYKRECNRCGYLEDQLGDSLWPWVVS